MSYSVANDTLNGVVHNETIEQEIKDSAITAVLDCIETTGDVLDFCFTPTLTPTEELLLDTVVFSHAGDPEAALAPYKAMIRNAIEFFNGMIESFGGENITLGITVAGKTKEVADYLKDVMRYGQSGSLYEVIGEIDALIAATIPTGLDPFVTEARLTAFKTKVQNYLGV